MQPERLTIIGVGLLGGSIGLAIKSILTDCQIIGYGHRATTLDTAIQTGAIDRAAASLPDSVRSADLVILCTPVGIFPQVLSGIAPALKDGAVVTDVGSTKRSIVRQAHQILPARVRFVGSHPMAGSEKRGVEFARADLFQHALCITTPTEDTDPAALQQVEVFWRTIGMRTTRLTPDEHDRRLAEVSHLPHVVAAAMVAMQDDAALSLAGKGFLDATRIAGGDGGLWRDILLDNQDNLRQSITQLKATLDHVLSLLDAPHAGDLRSWLDAAANRRQALLQQKLREINPD